MSQAFVKESEEQWLHEVAPTLNALIIYLTRENNGIRVYEKKTMPGPGGKQMHLMSNGLSYAIDNEGKMVRGVLKVLNKHLSISFISKNTASSLIKFIFQINTMKPNAICLALLSIVLVFQSCADQDSKEKQPTSPTEAEKTISLKEDSAHFSVDNITSKSFVVFDENRTGTRPVILVIPEWWGLNDFVKTKARQLAEMGYLAMAVDMYGNGKTVDNPTDANALSNPFYQDPQMSLRRVQAAINRVKTFPQADSSQVAGIGYCFGGGLLLNTARLGLDLDGVVSFHGNLIGTPAKKELLKAKILVCHGAADPFVPNEQAVAFKKSMDSIGANYTFKAYPDAMHAFTNPAATETGKKFNIPVAYNAAADTASWNDMKTFLGGLFTAK